MDKTFFLGKTLKALRLDVRALFDYTRAINRKDKEAASKIAAEYDKRCYWANEKANGRYDKDKKPWSK